MRREILLRGSISRRNFVFAKSWIALDHVCRDAERAYGIGETNRAAVVEYRLETAKEVLRFWREPSGDVAIHFGSDRDGMILAYLVEYGRESGLMVIAAVLSADLTLQSEAGGA